MCYCCILTHPLISIWVIITIRPVHWCQMIHGLYFCSKDTKRNDLFILVNTQCCLYLLPRLKQPVDTWHFSAALFTVEVCLNDVTRKTRRHTEGLGVDLTAISTLLLTYSNMYFVLYFKKEDFLVKLKLSKTTLFLLNML